MNIAVIIPTYNGAHKILNTLRALEHQSVKDFEVIVAIDGSNDGTQELLESTTFNLSNIKYIWQPNKGRAAIRNFGAKMASGDLLIFYDDDTRPEPDSILRHKDFHLAHPNSICTGFPLEDEKLMKTDIQKYKRWLSIKWTEKYNSGANNLSEKNLFFTAANMSVTRDLFFQLGGFDERLTDAEDYELTVRAFSKGVPVYFDKLNLAWHDDFITCKSYIRRQRQYNQANMTLQTILPPAFQQSASCLSSLALQKRIIYNFFSLKFWVIMADKSWLAWLPKKLRYKIFDIIITGLGKYYPQRSLD